MDEIRWPILSLALALRAIGVNIWIKPPAVAGMAMTFFALALILFVVIQGVWSARKWRGVGKPIRTAFRELRKDWKKADRQVNANVKNRRPWRHDEFRSNLSKRTRALLGHYCVKEAIDEYEAKLGYQAIRKRISDSVESVKRPRLPGREPVPFR